MRTFTLLFVSICLAACVQAQLTASYQFQNTTVDGTQQGTLTLSLDGEHLGMLTSSMSPDAQVSQMNIYFTAGQEEVVMFNPDQPDHGIRATLDPVQTPRLNRVDEKKTIRGRECVLYRGTSTDGRYEVWVDEGRTPGFWKFSALVNVPLMGGLIHSSIDGLPMEMTLTTPQDHKQTFKLVNLVEGTAQNTQLPGGVKVQTFEEFFKAQAIDRSEESPNDK